MSSDVAVVYLVGYGGGLVTGDKILIECTLHRDTYVILKTQASTKVYKTLNFETCEQTMEINIDANATLIQIPDPVTCFARSRFIQRQTLHLKSSSNLIFLDWMTGGRKRMKHSKERWLLDSYDSSIKIYIDNVPIVIDRVVLEDTQAFSLAERLGCVHAVGVLFIIGDRFREIQQVLAEQSRRRTQPNCRVDIFENVMASVSPLLNGSGTIVRFAADEAEYIYQALRQILRPLDLSL